MAESLAIIEEIGLPVMLAGRSMERGYVEWAAGDPAARERVLREGYEQLSAMGERGVLSTIAADIADALVDLGRLDEAEAMCGVAEGAGAEEDIFTQVLVRLARARLAAANHNMDIALAFAADALSLADRGEYYELLTSSRLVFAGLILDSGRNDEARPPAQEALDLARTRGDVVLQGRAKNLLERMAVSGPTSR